jgi:hypothetical protein
MQQKSGKKREKKTIPLNGMHTFSTDFNAKEVWWKKKRLENSAGRAKKLSHNQLVLHKDYTRQIEHICCENVH